MNRAEYIRKISGECGFTQKDIKEVLEAAEKVAYAEMAKKEEVKVFNGLTLVGQFKEACEKRNPATGAMVQVPAKMVPKAKWGVVAKRIINGEK